MYMCIFIERKRERPVCVCVYVCVVCVYEVKIRYAIKTELIYILYIK